MAITLTLSEAQINAVYVALAHYNPENDPEYYAGSVDLIALKEMEEIFEVAEGATVTYEEGIPDGD